MHDVGVWTPEQLVIAFHNGYFFLFTLFSCSMGDNGAVNIKGVMGCLLGSKNVCDFT